MVVYALIIVGVVLFDDIVELPIDGLWGALVCAVAIALAAVLTRQVVSRPLGDLSERASRIAAGEIVDLAEDRDDEIGELARSIRWMSAQMGQQLQQIRGEAAILQTILDGMSEGVIVCDIEGHVMLVNPAARELLGLGDAEVAGQHLLEVYRSPQLKDAMDECVLTGEPLTREMTLRRGEEPVHLVLAIAALRRVASVRGAVAVIHDITALRHLERVRRDFVANVSHELRTPLATITGYTETLLSGAVELDDVSREFIETIERHGKRLGAMVSDLLVLARLEAHGEGVPRSAVRISDVVVDVLDDLQPLATDREVTLRIKRLSEVPPVLADRRGLTQVLRNLLENGITYTDVGGKVTLNTNVLDKGRRVCIQVADTGIGIEAQHLPRIFERFYRVDEGRSRGAGGSGLGLALVKHMMLAMDGDITVKSTPGKGTTFYLTLDVAAAAPALAGGDAARQ
jgi:two-component system phosphate regulon sensor histidine kinase PhoR